MRTEEITAFLEPYWSAMREAMKAALCTEVAILADVNDKILGSGGKMLRPMVSLLVAKALGGEPNSDSVAFAAAVELLHNATLLHDDVADKSDTRRGKPTVYSLLGPSNAVLVGDFWLSCAVNAIVDTSHRDKMVKVFAKNLTNLAEGEMIQLQKSMTLDTTEEDYFKIIYCKTASLFEVACVSGAESVNAAPEMVEAAREYAESMGKAFQIKDDILDYVGTDKTGKPTGIDIKERKITLPLLGAFKNAGSSDKMHSFLKSADICPWKAVRLRRFVRENGGVEYAFATLEKYVQKACDALSAFPDSRAKEYLTEIARFNSIRQI